MFDLLRDIIPLFGGVLVLVFGLRWLVPLLRERKKFPGAPGKPYCCEMHCQNDAEFGIYGSSGHFEDVTEACAKHVGALLGTPTWLPKMNDHWVVRPL